MIRAAKSGEKKPPDLGAFVFCAQVQDLPFLLIQQLPKSFTPSKNRQTEHQQQRRQELESPDRQPQLHPQPLPQHRHRQPENHRNHRRIARVARVITDKA